MAPDSSALRLLVVDAFPREGRERLTSAGGTEAGTLYREILERIEPEASVDVLHAADTELPLPLPQSLSSYHGAVWTGSNLSVLDRQDASIGRMLSLVGDLLDAGVPNFGSCFALQIASVATGGRCAENPKGREFGVSRKIQLSSEGRAHPLYRDKPPVFDAFTSHSDEVVELGRGARLLASNEWSRVQGAEIENGPASFWAVQYHPEYDCHEVASLCRLRRDDLVEQGLFSSADEADRYSENLEALHEDPERSDLAQALDLGDAVLDPELRTLEVRNWLEQRVRADGR
jgi:GMP synthase (glutamine-hydrolysing)